MEQIVDAASRLLAVERFEDLTTKRLASEVGIGEATLFRFIESKQDLLTLVYGKQMDALLERIEHEDRRWLLAHEGTKPLPSHYFMRIFQIYRLRCDFYVSQPHNATLYLQEGFVAAGKTASLHMRQGDHTIRLVTEILRAAQDQSVLIRDIDPAIVAQNCHGTYMHEIQRTPVRHFSPDRIWDRLEPRLRVQLYPLALRPAEPGNTPQ